MNKENIVREIELNTISLNRVKRGLELVEACDYEGDYVGLIQPPFWQNWPIDERIDMPISVTKDYLVSSLKEQISLWESRIQKHNAELKTIDT